MKRRNFLTQSTAMAACGLLGTKRLVRGAEANSDELSSHKIDRVEFQKVRFSWPRPVGKNGRIGVHGQHKSASVAKLFTNQGAMGWGITAGNRKRDEESAQMVAGKPLNELIDPAAGILDGVPTQLDFALHDLAGIVLGQPVYQMLGAKGPKANTVYSG
ncbi:MAG: twin-arginine translocation signal domain-containing protein, partial [Planctomycetota bacterium]